MGLSKTAEKLNEHYERVKAGKVAKIKPSHVEKAIAKFEARERDLLDEIENAHKPSKIERLNKKLETTRDRIAQAKWLLDSIT